VESGSDRASTFVLEWFKEFDSPESETQNTDPPGRCSPLDGRQPAQQRRFPRRSLPVGAAAGVAAVVGLVLVVSILAGCSASHVAGPALDTVDDAATQTETVDTPPGPSVSTAPPATGTTSSGRQPARSEPTDADRARLSVARTSAAAMFAVLDAELAELGFAIDATDPAVP